MFEKKYKGLIIVITLGLCVALLWVGIALAAPGEIERITDFEQDSFTPLISGDGRFIAFLTYEEDNYRVYIADRATDPIMITKIDVDLNKAYSYYFHAISANGEWLAYRFYEMNEPSSQELHLLEWQVDPLDPIIIEQPAVGEGNFYFYDVSVSENGCRVAYSFEYSPTSGNDVRNVYYYDCNEDDSFLVSTAFDSTDLGNGRSLYPIISDNGQFIAFVSDATDLVESPPTDDWSHIYVRDLEDESTKSTKRIILPPEWEEKYTTADSISLSDKPSLSADGCYVTFDFGYREDSVWYYDIFLYDCVMNETKLISMFDGQPSGNSIRPSISGDARFVAFSRQIGDHYQLYIYDSETGGIELISNGFDGNLGNSFSGCPDLSADGRFIAFESWADNLVPDDENEARDVFVYEVDLSTGYSVFLPLITR